MRHRKKTLKLNRTSAHRKALLSNLVSSLIREEKLVTTLPKAKAAQPLAERMVTLSKRDTLAAHRRAVKFLRDKKVVKKLFSEIGPRFPERAGGYTRILRIASARRGDGAGLAQLAFVEEGGGPKKEKKKRTNTRKKQ